MSDQPPWRNAAFKVFFDRKGKAERVVQILSSGNKERDALCIEYCRNMVIPIPRVGRRLTGELWRTVTFPANMTFTRN